MSPRDIDAILAKLDHHGQLLQEIRKHAAATNGRVNQLELWRARMEGAGSAASKPLLFVAAIASGSIAGILAERLS
jgi:hypothetical protein